MVFVAVVIGISRMGMPWFLARVAYYLPVQHRSASDVTFDYEARALTE